MHHHRHAMATLVAACLALGIAPAFAARPAPTPATPPGGPPVEITSGSVSGTTTVCQLGVVGPAAQVFSYVYPPNDAYYTLVNPATCGECPSNSHLLSLAHMRLYFRGPCEIPVTVSIVPAVDLGGGCLAPNPLAPPICGPVDLMISDDGVTGQCVDYPVSLPAACFIDQPVFLHVEFDQGSCPIGQPMFCSPAACSNCTQYSFYPGGPTGGEDLCATQSFASIMYVESTCSAPTSTAPGSWGRLKTLYR